MDTSYLPARPSMNTFFVRHVAHPKRMVHIEGKHLLYFDLSITNSVND